jgi:hypothetical protein
VIAGHDCREGLYGQIERGSAEREPDRTQSAASPVPDNSQRTTLLAPISTSESSPNTARATEGACTAATARTKHRPHSRATSQLLADACYEPPTVIGSHALVLVFGEFAGRFVGTVEFLGDALVTISSDFFADGASQGLGSGSVTSGTVRLQVDYSGCSTSPKPWQRPARIARHNGLCRTSPHPVGSSQGHRRGRREDPLRVFHTRQDCAGIRDPAALAATNRPYGARRCPVCAPR